MYWEENGILILSDLHFGKTGHFRKSGIAVPQNIFKEDLQRLVQQVQFFKPASVLITGDFTHSEDNAELNLFLKWRPGLGTIPIKLVKGNHDILAAGWYAAAEIEIVEKQWDEAPFRFLHDPEDVREEDSPLFTFSGHLHPGVRLAGAGKQSLRFPCFHFSANNALLPAFSHFTGYKLVNKTKGDRIFALVEKKVIEIA